MVGWSSQSRMDRRHEFWILCIKAYEEFLCHIQFLIPTYMDVYAWWNGLSQLACPATHGLPQVMVAEGTIALS